MKNRVWVHWDEKKGGKLEEIKLVLEFCFLFWLGVDAAPLFITSRIQMAIPAVNCPILLEIRIIVRKQGGYLWLIAANRR